MQAIKWLGNNLLNILVLALCLIIILQRCNEKQPDNKPKVIKDTVWVVKEGSVITKQPIFIKGERDTILEKSIEYYPSADYNELLIQFSELKKELLSRNYYKDSLKIDSIGWVKVEDTIQQNRISGRKWEYNLKYPIITKTVIYPPKLTRQLYVGGGIGGNNIKPLSDVEIGLLYKNRKDQIFGMGIQKTFDEQPITYNLKSYWKIKIKK